jgi:hypothetical protein
MRSHGASLHLGGSATLSVTDGCLWRDGDGALSHVGNRTMWSILLTSEKFTQMNDGRPVRVAVPARNSFLNNVQK